MAIPKTGPYLYVEQTKMAKGLCSETLVVTGRLDITDLKDNAKKRQHALRYLAERTPDGYQTRETASIVKLILMRPTLTPPKNDSNPIS